MKSLHKLLTMNSLTVFKFPGMATFFHSKAAPLLSGDSDLDIPMVCLLMYTPYLCVWSSASLSSQQNT